MIRLAIHPENPQPRLIQQAIGHLVSEQALTVYPTETSYGLGGVAGIDSIVHRINMVLGKDKSRLLSFICSDFHQINELAIVENHQFRIMKRYLPGPFTFLLEANRKVAKKLGQKREIIGVRYPDHKICNDLVSALDHPLLHASLPLEPYELGDPWAIETQLGPCIDLLIDGGFIEDSGKTTVVDLTGEEPILVRPGKGDWQE